MINSLLKWFLKVYLLSNCILYSVPAFGFLLSDTGQTTCYSMKGKLKIIECPSAGDSTAQDGSYRINPFAYNIPGDRTVFDENTHLTWQQTADGVARTCNEAVTYCENLSLAGYTDWRLPTKKELISIVDYGRYSPSIIPPLYTYNNYWGYYLSATPYSQDPNLLGIVSFIHGSTGIHECRDDNYDHVRCVRGDQLVHNQFIDNGDGTVSDITTGLTWQQDEGGYLEWKDALAYCETLSLGGADDWRLPNIREIVSLTDSTTYSPSIDRNFFPYAHSSSYWSSTNYNYNPEYAYSVSFKQGDISPWLFKTTERATRCVRGKRESSFDAVEITVKPEVLGFGIIDINSTRSLDITIANTGLGDLIISALEGPSEPFLIQYDGCSHQRLGAQGSCTLTITFSPLEDDIYMDTLSVPSNDVDNPIVTVDILGITAPFLPDTGQTICYDNDGNPIDCPLPGEPLAQDGSYTINPPSYTVNGDGTVTDNVTGLMWQQEDDNQQYNWYQAAGIYDKRLNRKYDDVCGGLTLGGYTDWRLPSKKELMSIVNFGLNNPAIDTAAFPNTDSRYLSSSETSATDLDIIWLIDFSPIGQIQYGTKASDGSVRCVRGQELRYGDFIINGDGTVTDSATRLMWWQHSAHNSELPVLPTTLCENSTQSGYTDWRLPNIRELESLTDDLRQNPNINTSIFTPSLNHDYAWLLSSTSNTMFPGEKWYIELMSGRSDSYISLNTILGCDMGLYFCEYFVKCVRGLDSSLPVTLTGIVTDASTMQSLEDVSITVTDLQNIHSTLTDSNGQYIIENLVPGNFIGVFEKSGYITHTENGVLINGQTLVLDIQLALIPSPLTVIITSPENGAILNSSPVEVTGTVSNNAEVTVNGIDATVNNDIFSATIPLNEGQNTITAIAHDEFGQTETQNVTVTLLTKGSITGKVTDVMTGLPVPDSQVSITDSLNNILSAITDSSGQYTVNAVSQGNFTGMISKDCYMPHHFSGTVMPGQVHMYDANLHPAPPTISDIALSTVSYDSATITWTTDHLSDSTVEYGIDASYGNSVTDATLTTAHSITLTNLLSETTYHFMVTSTNSNNLSASSEDDTFITLNPITVTITSPLDGATLSHPDITVSGTITNAQGNETGVVVSGIIATLNGNNFVANNIPLIEGSNTITATATDTTGNTSSTSLGINLQTPVHYIRLTSNIESGISPLETTFRIEGSFSFDESSIFVTGPTQPEFIESDVDEYTFRLTMEGIYYFTANVTGPDGLAYEDTIAINVIDQPEIDTLLQNKWTSLTNNLRDSKIQHALLWITSESQKVYEEIFNALIDQLPFIMSTEIEFNLISIHNGIATYDLVTKEDGRNLSYEVIFITDSNGIWKIHEF